MLKIGTDFSGIGSPETALKRLKLPIEEVFACEVDKYARKSYEALHSPATFYEDITTRDHSEVPPLDLYVAGFPCQTFSMAGSRRGFDDTRGTLFFNVAEFIKENQPNCFILENVRGLLSHDNGRTFQTIIDVLSNGGGTVNNQTGLDSIDNGLGYHIHYKILNTKDFGIPQNRERIFIVGFKYTRVFNFPKEFPLKLKLKDILEDSVDEKFYLSGKMLEYLKTAKRALPFTDPNTKNVTNCITANYHKQSTDIEYIIHNLQRRSADRPSIKKNKNAGGTGHLSKSDGIVYCLDSANTQAVENNKRIRRLTPLECWRLQGFTDEEFYKAEKTNSNSQLYKQAGNSITVNVMVELLKKIYLK